MTPFSIRRLVPSDVPALEHLQARCFPVSLHDTPEDIMFFVSTALVALGAFDHMGTLLGEVGIVQPQDGSDIELYAIETVPELRRNGIGMSLVKAGLQEVTSRPIMAYCTPEGRRLLGNVGFVLTGGSFVRGAVDLVEMRLDATADVSG